MHGCKQISLPTNAHQLYATWLLLSLKLARVVCNDVGDMPRRVCVWCRSTLWKYGAVFSHPLSPGAPGCLCDANCFCYLCQVPTVLWHSTDRTESLSYFCVCLRNEKMRLAICVKKTSLLSFLVPPVLAFPVAATVTITLRFSLRGFGCRKKVSLLRKDTYNRQYETNNSRGSCFDFLTCRVNKENERNEQRREILWSSIRVKYNQDRESFQYFFFTFKYQYNTYAITPVGQSVSRSCSQSFTVRMLQFWNETECNILGRTLSGSVVKEIPGPNVHAESYAVAKNVARARWFFRIRVKWRKNNRYNMYQ